MDEEEEEKMEKSYTPGPEQPLRSNFLENLPGVTATDS